MPIEAKVTGASQITATVGESVIDVSVGGGVGPTGSQGSSGVVSVSAPLVNGGSASAAQLSLSVGAGLQVSGGSLALATHTHTASQITDFNAAVVAAAPPTTNASLLTSGTLPDARLSANIARTSDITSAVNSLVDSAPGALDTLNELAAALGDDANFASTVTSALAGKAASVHTHAASDIVSGTLSASRLPIAAAGTLGGVRIGSGISIDGSGVISASSGYTLPTASANTLGGVKIGSGITITDGVISVSSASVAWDDITGKPSTFAPSAHAASHEAGGVDQLFDQDLNTTDDPSFNTVNALYGGTLVSDQAGEWTVVVASDGNSSGTITLTGTQDSPPYGAASLVISALGITFPDSSVQATAYTGKIGTVAGLVLKTGTDGVIEALAMGTAGQVLKVNSGATGVEWGSAAADVSIDTTAADILSASSGSITADDPGADRLVFWDDSAGKLTYLSAGTNITITDTTISAAGSTSASDLTSGTLAYARMADPTVTSPSQITASQNDYASFARGINRFTTNAARDLTGMVAGSDGEVRVLCNVGTTAANTLTIKDESSSSTAANRFSVPWNGDCVIPAEGSVVVFYDGTSSRWRVIA